MSEVYGGTTMLSLVFKSHTNSMNSLASDTTLMRTLTNSLEALTFRGIFNDLPKKKVFMTAQNSTQQLKASVTMDQAGMSSMNNKIRPMKKNLIML